MLNVKQYKTFIVNAILFIGLIVFTYFLYEQSKSSLNRTAIKIGEIFSNSNIWDPLQIWVYSTGFIWVSIGILEYLLHNSKFGTLPFLKTGLAAFAIIYLIYVGPIIFFVLVLLFNVSIMHITLVLSLISFLGVTFKKGEKLLCTIYNKIKDII